MNSTQQFNEEKNSVCVCMSVSAVPHLCRFQETAFAAVRYMKVRTK